MTQTDVVWTLAELDRLPDDGNKYELVDGALFVTPAPSPAHESLGSELHTILDPYVRAQRIGKVFRPRAVVRVDGSEVEPDIMVRPNTPSIPSTWELAPIPLLVVEIASRTTRLRDHAQKREFYLRCGVAQYWIVDGERRTIRVVAPNADDVVVENEMVWQPAGASAALTIDVAAYFREALG
ncbi:MAG: Uma2 family endonuclease [Gemmatimonadaceae bacterium]|nr:Uma2 family endonuclease [Gemmatimonadaceae bacterium]